MLFVRRRKHFALVNVVDFERFEHLRFGKMPDAHLGHYRNGDDLHDFADHARRGHARDAAFLANVGGHALERHHGAGAGLFGDFRLLRVRDVHDHAALQHLREAHLHAPQAITHQIHLLLLSNCRLALTSLPNGRLRAKSSSVFLSVNRRFRRTIPLRINANKNRPATREHDAGSAANFALADDLASVALGLPTLDDDLLVDGHGLQVLHGKLARHSAIAPEPVELRHHLVEQQSHDAAVDDSSAALKIRGNSENAADSPSGVVLFECELHAARVRASTTEAVIRNVGRE